MLKGWKMKRQSTLWSWLKKGQQVLQEGPKANLYTTSSLLWKEIATTWYSDSHSNNIWWIITLIFCFCITYFSFIFCLSFKLNNFCIVLCSAFQNWSNQHIWLISSFAVKYHELLSLCLYGGAGLSCRPNQRCLTYQQWISVAVIHSVKIMTISSNVK